MGSGKSTAKRILSRRIPTIDCDGINAALLEKNHDGYTELKKAGLLYTDEQGNIDRQAMADAMFENPDKRKRMEQILHPLIVRDLKNWIGEQTDVCAAEVPLLFECSLEHLFDEVWTVVCSTETALCRLESGRNISREEATRRLALQYPVDRKKAASDRVLENDRTEKDLEKIIDGYLEDVRKGSGR